MTFQLTDKLEEEILRALEDQNQFYCVDAQNLTLIPTSSVSADEEFFYALPEWNSANGFELREDFVSTLHSPIAKDELQRILHSGRGVFRSFKNTLREYPEVEKLWHHFKNKKMHQYIKDWYNSLREIWGLETLCQEPEDNEDLIKDDFTFREYDSADNQELIQHFTNAAFGETDNCIHEEIQQVFFDLWQKQFEAGINSQQTGITCHSIYDDFAGCITAAPLSSRNKNIVILTSFYVLPKYRGLGLGEQLLSMYLQALKDQKKQWILLTNSFVPETLEPLLLRSGFQKTGTSYAAQIQ